MIIDNKRQGLSVIFNILKEGIPTIPSRRSKLDDILFCKSKYYDESLTKRTFI